MNTLTHSSKDQMMHEGNLELVFFILSHLTEQKVSFLVRNVTKLHECILSHNVLLD